MTVRWREIRFDASQRRAEPGLGEVASHRAFSAVVRRRRDRGLGRRRRQRHLDLDLVAHADAEVGRRRNLDVGDLQRELRLHHLPVWRESTLFSPRERAALAWTEILTRLPEQGVADDVYDRVRTQLSDKELSDLSFSVMAINAWNRLNVGFRTVPGSADKAYGLDKAGLE